MNTVTERPGAGTGLSFQDAFKAAWPISLGYIPIGLAFGVLAQKAGWTPLQVALMSVVVFAGSSQFIALSMWQTGAGLVAIVVTTFMVNLRHLLMSSSLAVYLQGASKRLVTLFSYGVTDESFAVNLSLFRDHTWHPYQALTVNHVANATWFVSTVLGAVVGQFIPEGAFGLDYALIAMFICLLVFQLRGRIYLITGVVAGVAAVILALVIPGNLYVVLASLLAATLGFELRRRERRSVRTRDQREEPAPERNPKRERD